MSEKTTDIVELRTLLAKLCEGELDAEGYQRIEELVSGNPEARNLYVDTVLLHGELHWANSGGALPVGAITPISSRSIARTFSRPLPLLGAAVAAGLLLAATVFFQGRDLEHDLVPEAKPLVVAELQQEDGCEWSVDSGELTEGASLVAGQRLELTAGVARLLFTSGTTVLVESPALLEMVSSNSLRLDEGSLAVRVSGPVKEFVVISPDASIVDKGTSFVVHYDKESSTEVEVLEGSVEVHSEVDPSNPRLLEMGTSVNIGQQGKEISYVARRWSEYRFAALIERLWKELRDDSPLEEEPSDRSTVDATFAEGPAPGKVDTFLGAVPGRGWLTPWVASGNPSSEIVSNDPVFGLDTPLLRVRFTEAFDRAIAREYGPRQSFDPSQPHLITWRWRIDGNPEDFGGHFHDRVAFYGNPSFRRNTWPTNSWLIGVAGDHDVRRRAGPSTQWIREKYGPLVDEDQASHHQRQVYPMRWYVFDRQSDAPIGGVFDRQNMVDTGIELQFDTVYHFAVAVYPAEGRYDAAIRDGDRTVVHTGLSFRSGTTDLANVLHFAISTNKASDDVGFSLSGVRIEPLSGIDSQREIDLELRQSTRRDETVPE
jgi:hypothetical protein